MGIITDLNTGGVLFSDGEGLDYVDLNGAQNKVLRTLLDNCLASLLPDAILNDATGTGDPDSAFDPDYSTNLTALLAGDFTAFVQAPIPGSAYWRPTATSNQVELVSGPLAMVTDEPPATSTTPAVAPLFSLGRGLVATLTTAVGNGSNPRIDLIEVKAEWVDTTSTSRDFKDATTGQVTTNAFNKDRSVKFTYQLKQGTPAAIPTYPVPSSGFRAMAAIWVPTSHNAVHLRANLRDMRVPMGGLRTYDVNNHGFLLLGGTPWTLANFDAVAPGGTPTAIYIPCPVSSKTSRLMGVGLYGVCAGTASCKLVRIEHDGSGMPTETDLAQFDADLFDTAGYRFVNTVQLMDYLSYTAGGGAHGSATVKGDRAADAAVGSPIWCSGDAAGPMNNRTSWGLANAPQICLKVNGDTASTLGLVRWLVAHGM
jgi:hypothetical protein